MAAAPPDFTFKVPGMKKEKKKAGREQASAVSISKILLEALSRGLLFTTHRPEWLATVV